MRRNFYLTASDEKVYKAFQRLAKKRKVSLSHDLVRLMREELDRAAAVRKAITPKPKTPKPAPVVDPVPANLHREEDRHA